MKKRKGIVLALALMLAVCLVAGTGSSSVYAKSKKVYYDGSFRGNVKDKDKSGIISKVYISKNKMVVKGSMRKAYTKKGLIYIYLDDKLNLVKIDGGDIHG